MHIRPTLKTDKDKSYLSIDPLGIRIKFLLLSVRLHANYF